MLCYGNQEFFGGLSLDNYVDPPAQPGVLVQEYLLVVHSVCLVRMRGSVLWLQV